MENNRSRLFIPLVVAIIITALLGLTLIVLELTESEPSVTDSTDTAETTPSEDEVPAAIFKSDLEEYEEYMDVTDEKYLILVNKTSTIDESFEPERLIPVADARKEIELAETAEKALEAMFIEMRAQGFGGVFVTSAYRSYSYQNSLFNTYINTEMATGLSYYEAKEKVLTYSAYPGTSEHHTGLSVDLMTSSMRELDESFADDPAYPWLLENAWKFGFILRYPHDKVDVTGYSFEPWHYRFVGRYHAYKIHSEGLCLEEYLEKK